MKTKQQLEDEERSFAMLDRLSVLRQLDRLAPAQLVAHVEQFEDGDDMRREVVRSVGLSVSDSESGAQLRAKFDTAVELLQAHRSKLTGRDVTTDERKQVTDNLAERANMQSKKGGNA